VAGARRAGTHRVGGRGGEGEREGGCGGGGGEGRGCGGRRAGCGGRGGVHGQRAAARGGARRGARRRSGAGGGRRGAKGGAGGRPLPQERHAAGCASAAVLALRRCRCYDGPTRACAPADSRWPGSALTWQGGGVRWFVPIRAAARSHSRALRRSTAPFSPQPARPGLASLPQGSRHFPPIWRRRARRGRRARLPPRAGRRLISRRSTRWSTPGARQRQRRYGAVRGCGARGRADAARRRGGRTLWFDNPNGRQKQNSYGQTLRSVYTFSTVEDFWWCAAAAPARRAARRPPGSHQP
jgi:hypothetical protein